MGARKPKKSPIKQTKTTQSVTGGIPTPERGNDINIGV
jgi:hypothetical protein